MASFDDKLATALEESGDLIIARVKEVLDTEKLYEVKCNKSCCRSSTGFKASFPDVNALLNLAKWWTDRVEGSAPKKEQEKPKTTSKPHEQMTDDELEALLAEGTTKRPFPTNTTPGVSVER